MDSGNSEEKSYLQKAVEEADFRSIRSELKRNPEAWKIRDPVGRSALHFAFEIYRNGADVFDHNKEYIEDVIKKIIKIFVHLGLNVDAQADDGKTALWLAVELQLQRVAEFLISLRANKKVKNSDGDNLAMLLVTIVAKFEPISNPEYWSLILRGSDVDVPNHAGQTACRFCIENELLPIALLLASKTNEINFANSKGRNIGHLVLCSKYVSEENLKILLDRGLQIDMVDNDGRTPMHSSAAMECVSKSTYFLVDRINDLNLRDFYGNSILHYAARSRDSAEFCQILIANNAELHQKGQNDLYPVQIAALYNNVLLMKIFENCEVQFDVCTDDDATLLHLAARREGKILNLAGIGEVIEVLLRKGCSIEASQCSDGRTPLHVAVEVNNLPAAIELLERGANVNARDENNITPLHIAISGAFEEIVDWLMRFEADTDARDNNGSSPLEIALRYNNLHIVQCLLQNGANINDIATRKSQIGYLKIARQFSICWHTIERYCCLLKAAELPIASGLSVLVDFDSQNVKQIFQRRQTEAKFLKTYEMSSGNSLYDVLKHTPQRRHKYSDKLLSILVDDELESFRMSIPHYVEILRASFKETIERRRICKQTIKFFDRLYNSYVNLPELCIEMISSYLSNADIKSLSYCLEPLQNIT